MSMPLLKQLKQFCQPNLTTGKEFETGRLIDGKKEYCKRINIGALPNSTSKYISTGLNNVTIQKFECVSKSNSVQYNIPYISQVVNNNVNIYFNASGTALTIFTQSDRTSETATINLYYTKN